MQIRGINEPIPYDMGMGTHPTKPRTPDPVSLRVTLRGDRYAVSQALQALARPEIVLEIEKTEKVLKG